MRLILRLMLVPVLAATSFVAPGSAVVPPEGLGIAVEPFDFHYPDEVEYPAIDDTVRIRTTMGERSTGTFVYVPSQSGRAVATVGELTAANGAILPAEYVDIGVVTFMDRTRPPHFLENIWLHGDNADVENRAPLMPMTIVPDEHEFIAGAPEAMGAIRLRSCEGAAAVAVPNHGNQFWLTVNVPATITVPGLLSTFRGTVEVVSPGGEVLAVPLEISVLGTELDDLGTHDRFVGVFQTVDQLGPEFRGAVLRDLRSRGINTILHRKAGPEDYLQFRDSGIDLVINADDLDASADQINEVTALGLPPLFYGFDEPALHGTETQHIRAGEAIRARGGMIGTSGTLESLVRITEQSPQDWFNLSFATSWPPTAPVFAHFDRVRSSPDEKIAGLESIYPMTLMELYPLNTRVLYGLWLYSSGLDGGMAWAYADQAGTVNPYLRTDYNGVAFPAEFLESAGACPARAMLTSYVWEAFGSGVSDMRYALTVERLLNERGTPDQRARFYEILEPFQQIFSGSQFTRIDVRNSNADVRDARSRLFDLLQELLD